MSPILASYGASMNLVNFRSVDLSLKIFFNLHFYLLL